MYWDISPPKSPKHLLCFLVQHIIYHCQSHGLLLQNFHQTFVFLPTWNWDVWKFLLLPDIFNGICSIISQSALTLDSVTIQRLSFHKRKCQMLDYPQQIAAPAFFPARFKARRHWVTTISINMTWPYRDLERNTIDALVFNLHILAAKMA